MLNSSPISRVVLAGMALPIGASVLLAAAWYVDYNNALRALKAGQHAKAAVLLEKAIALRSEPSKRVLTYGQRYVEYYPYFYLGKCYVALRDGARARQRFETSQRLGELKNAPLLAHARAGALASLRDVAPAVVTLPSDERKRVEKKLSNAEALAAQGKPAAAWVVLGDLRRSLPAIPDADEYRRRVDRAIQEAGRQQVWAKKELKAGLESLEKGADRAARQHLQKAVELDGTLKAARDALSLLEKNEQAAAQLRDHNDEAAREWLNTEGELVAETKETEKGSPSPDWLAEARAAVEQRLIGIATRKLQAGESLDPGSEDLAVLRAELQDAAKEKARRAFALQMEGSFAQAIQQYEDALVALSERPTAHLYLALACYARFLVEGKTDAGLAERAREEMREALRIDPGIEPDPRFMSPRVAILLEEIRRGAAPH